MSRIRAESAERRRGRSKERRQSAHSAAEDGEKTTITELVHGKRSLFRRMFSKSPAHAPSLTRDPSVSKKEGSATKEFVGNWNVAFDKKGNLFLSDYRDNHVRMIKAQDLAALFPDPATNPTIQTKNLNSIIRAGLARGGKNMNVENVFVSHPSGITLNPRGGMILADTFNHRICEISPKGVMTTLAGNNESREGREDGREGWRASFSFPRGMDVDKEGNVYVADWGSHLIRKITTQGGESAITTTLAGNPKLKGHKDGQGSEARFYRPCDVAVDAEGNVFVADQKNNRIRKITPDGVTSTVAGKDKAGKVDGRRALFNHPTGVAVNSLGSVLVADQDNNELRVISPLGFTFSVTDGNVFDRPCGVAVDVAGNAILVDHLDSLYFVPAGLMSELEQKKEIEVKASGAENEDRSVSSKSSNSSRKNTRVDPESRDLSRTLTRDDANGSFTGIRCRVCREITENNEPLCEYHTLLSGGLTVAAEFKDEESRVRSGSEKGGGLHVSIMEKTKDLLSALSRHGHERGSDNSYSARLSASSNGRQSVNGSYCEKLDTRAMLAADPTLERVLVVPIALHFFARFLILEKSEENIEFWDSVNKWMYDCDLGNLSNEALLDDANTIIGTFIGEDAPRQVNLTSAVVAQVRAAERLHDMTLKILDLREAFSVSKAAVMKLLGEDGFRRFLKSPLWQEFLSATQEINTGPTQSVHLPNGDLYVGEVKDGKFHGQGAIVYHNGDKFTGRFRDGFMHGVGEFSTKKERFVGEFQEDLKHGEGVLYQDNENFVEGVWVRDKLNGQGTTHEGAKIFDTIWADGMVVCKVERSTVRLLGNYVAEHLVGSRRVYCSVGINGVDFGYSKGRSSQQETGILLWSCLESVAIDTATSQVTLRFTKHGQARSIVIQPCEPMVTTNSIIERVDFLERANNSHNVGLLLVQAKVLFARIDEKLKRQQEYTVRLGEVQNSLTEVDITLSELQEEADPNDSVRHHVLSVDRLHLPDIKKERVKLCAEQQQLEYYLDPSLLLADYKLLRDLQARLSEQKSPSSEKGTSPKMTFGQKLTLGPPRRHSPSPRRGTPSPKAHDELHHVEDLANKAAVLFQAHNIPTA